METTLVAPHCAGTSRICGKIKKSNVLHYICHFTSDKNIFLYSWLFFSLTWAENEHWQPLVALRPLEAVKSFISCPCDTGKQPLIPKIVSDTGKMTNEWSKVLIPCSGVNYCVNAKFGNQTIRGCGIPQFDPASIATGSVKANWFFSYLLRWIEICKLQKIFWR